MADKYGDKFGEAGGGTTAPQFGPEDIPNLHAAYGASGADREALDNALKELLKTEEGEEAWTDYLHEILNTVGNRDGTLNAMMYADSFAQLPMQMLVSTERPDWMKFGVHDPQDDTVRDENPFNPRDRGGKVGNSPKQATQKVILPDGTVSGGGGSVGDNPGNGYDGAVSEGLGRAGANIKGMYGG